MPSFFRIRHPAAMDECRLEKCLSFGIAFRCRGGLDFVGGRGKGALLALFPGLFRVVVGIFLAC
jgi:hypothetical protein